MNFRYTIREKMQTLAYIKKIHLTKYRATPLYKDPVILRVAIWTYDRRSTLLLLFKSNYPDLPILIVTVLSIFCELLLWLPFVNLTNILCFFEFRACMIFQTISLYFIVSIYFRSLYMPYRSIYAYFDIFKLFTL